MSVTLSLSVGELTFRAAAIAGVAVFAILALGWRQHARAQTPAPRASRHMPPGAPREPAPGIVVDHVDAPEYRPPSIVRRLFAAVTSGAIAILIGVLTAIVLSFTLAFAVIEMTKLLRG